MKKMRWCNSKYAENRGDHCKTNKTMNTNLFFQQRKKRREAILLHKGP